MTEIVCWRCGQPLAADHGRISRRDQCTACGADLHVCRLCGFYAPGRSKACRETVVDEVTVKDKANFCDYFQARPAAHDAGVAEREAAARQALQSLFGDTPAPTSATEARDALEQLFAPVKKPDGD